MSSVYSLLTVPLIFAIRQYGPSLLFPPANLCAYQNSTVLVPKSVYVTKLNTIKLETPPKIYQTLHQALPWKLHVQSDFRVPK